MFTGSRIPMRLAVFLLIVAGQWALGQRPVRPPRPGQVSNPPTITTTQIFDGEVGFFSSFGLAATGGTTPYSWAITAGALPAGTSIDGTTGIISGIPTQAITATFTAQVTDAAAGTDAKSLTWKVNPTAVVQEPLATVAIPPSPSPISGLLVSAGGSLQSTINGAPCGTNITLQPGAVFTGTFTFPNKNCTDYMTVRTQVADENFVPPGTRVTAADAVNMPQLITNTVNSPAIRVASTSTSVPGGSYWRFIGIEVTLTEAIATSTTHFSGSLVNLGGGETSTANQPHHVIIERCYIHGTVNTELRRGVQMNGAFQAVIDSLITEVHETGADSQGIGGFNGPGPFLVENNRIEGSGENILFGGSKGTVPDVVPSDITIRRNYLFKPLTWRKNSPTWGGSTWLVKNLLELKNAQRVLIEANVLENSWADGQTGYALLFTPRSASGQGWPNTVVTSVTVRKNVLINAGGGFSIQGDDTDEVSPRPLRGSRFKIENNLFLNINRTSLANGGSGGDGFLFKLNAGPADVTIAHNSFFLVGTGTAISVVGLVAGTTPSNRPVSPFIFKNNLMDHGTYGIICSGLGGGELALLNCYNPPLFTFNNNVLVNLGSNPPSKYPASNLTCGGNNTCYPTSYAGVGMIDSTACTTAFNIVKCGLAVGSVYKNAGDDGKDIGADINGPGTGIVVATTGVKQ
jgi:hypothetical protein